MTTDTSEPGLERLICSALTGHPCDPSVTGTVAEPAAAWWRRLESRRFR